MPAEAPSRVRAPHIPMLLLLVVCTALLFVSFWVDARYLTGPIWWGIHCEDSDLGPRAVMVYDRGMAHRLGVREQDVIGSVQGVEISRPGLVDAHLAGIVPGDDVTFVVQRGDDELIVTGIAESVSIPQSNAAMDWLLMFAQLLLLGTGALVFLSKPDDGRAIVLCLLFLSLAVEGAMSNPQLYPVAIRHPAWVFMGIMDTLIPILFLHFALLFPRNTPIKRRFPWIDRLIYAPLILFIPLRLTNAWGEPLLGIPQTVIASWAPIETILTLLYYLCGLAIYGVAFRFSWSHFDRQRLRLTYASVSATFGTMVVALILWALLGPVPGTAFWIAVVLFALCLPLVPLSFTYAVLTQRIPGIRLVIRSGLRHALAKRTLQMLFVLPAVLLLGRILVNQSASGTEAVLLMASVVLSLRPPARVFGVVDRRFFREAHDREQLLMLLAREAAAMGNLQSLFEVVTDRIAATLRPATLVILMHRPELAAFVPGKAFRVPDERVEAISVSEDSPVCLALRSSGQPVEVAGEHAELMTSSEVLEHPETARLVDLAHSEVVFPISAGTQLVGMLALGQKRSEEPYSAEDQDLLAGVLASVAVAIENARLREKEREKQVLDEQIERARDIQTQLLPGDLPTLPGLELAATCVPCHMVGGDYYDAVRLSDTQVAFVIADVSGKGLAAGLLMSNVQAGWRTLVSEGNTSSIILERLNGLVHSNTAPEQFVTLFHTVLNTETGVLTCGNAGHCLPVLVKTNGEMEWLETGGLPLGILDEGTYPEQTIALGKGDVLVMYTDGVTEASRAPDTDQYGEERLAASLIRERDNPAQQIVDSVIREVREFCDSQDLGDDITLFVLAYR